MALTLYYLSGSPYAWRVWLALEHKGIPCQLRSMSYDAGDFQKPDFAALNPRRRVPVVVEEDGFALYESAAIVFPALTGRSMHHASVVSTSPVSVLASSRTVHRIRPALVVRPQPGQSARDRQAACPRFLTLPWRRRGSVGRERAGQGRSAWVVGASRSPRVCGVEPATMGRERLAQGCTMPTRRGAEHATTRQGCWARHEGSGFSRSVQQVASGMPTGSNPCHGGKGCGERWMAMRPRSAGPSNPFYLVSPKSRTYQARERTLGRTGWSSFILPWPTCRPTRYPLRKPPCGPVRPIPRCY